MAVEAWFCRPDHYTEKFYAIGLERKLKHPALVAITQAARKVFAPA